MNAVLISGITGFVGKNLSSYLSNDYEVEGVYRGAKNNQLSYTSITSESFNNKKAFIHLAGKAHDLANSSNPKEYFEVNTELTKILFDKFLESNCEKFIFISTVKAVADIAENILTEEITPQPKTPYGQSKLEAEKYILSKPLKDGQSIFILRPCMIHGPENKGNLNLLYSVISKGIPYPLGRYNNKRSFVSIDNLCFIIKKIIEQDIKSGIYHIADDRSLSTKELVQFIGQEIGKPVKIFNFPIWMVEFIAKLGDLFRLPFNSHRLDKLTENYEVSNKKITKELNISLPFTTLEGLKKTINHFK